MFSLLMSGWQLAKQGAASVYQIWSCLIMSHPDQRNSSTTHDVCKSNQLQIAEMEGFFSHLVVLCLDDKEFLFPSQVTFGKGEGGTG